MKRFWVILFASIPLVLVGSIAVWQLSGSDARRVGAIGATDKPVALMWRGAWDAKAEYTAGQVVSYRGSSYVADATSFGQAPNAKESSWSVMASMGFQGPPGVAGPPGAVTSLDALKGLPCNVGNAGEGTTNVIYDPGTEAATLKCKPAELVWLIVSAQPHGHSYPCDNWTNTFNPGTVCGYSHYADVEVKGPSNAVLGRCANSSYTGSYIITCRYLVARNATITLRPMSDGTWAGACSGTTAAAECSIVMSEERTVFRSAI